MTITDTERATLIALADALDSDDHARVGRAVQAALNAMTLSVVHGEVGGAIKALGRYARRVRIRRTQEVQP